MKRTVNFVIACLITICLIVPNLYAAEKREKFGADKRHDQVAKLKVD
ncbi:MAG: hypothetical protein HQK74_04455, partial [Desulfamplus sp.]|nr:hypothetical protein [Desulfamplus sp.]